MKQTLFVLCAGLFAMAVMPPGTWGSTQESTATVLDQLAGTWNGGPAIASLAWTPDGRYRIETSSWKVELSPTGEDGRYALAGEDGRAWIEGTTLVLEWAGGGRRELAPTAAGYDERSYDRKGDRWIERGLIRFVREK